MALHYRKITGYKYVVANQYRGAVPELLGIDVEHQWFQIRSGEMLVWPGYAWNGASGPTLDTSATIKASLVHDVGYQAIRAGLMDPEHRADVDAALYRILRRAQHSWAAGRPTATGRAAAAFWTETRALYYFAAVRAFGRSSTKPLEVEPQDQIYIA
jgi:hypothetical protein